MATAMTETRVSSVTSELYRLFVSDAPATPAVATPAVATPAAAQPKPALVRARRSTTPLPLPESTGCSMKGVTKTVLTVPVSGAERLDATLRLVQPATERALQNGNDVHLIFLGSSAATAPRLTAMAASGVGRVTNVHLVAGDLNELKALSREQAMQYLRRCSPVVVLGGEEDGAGALWAAARGQPLDIANAAERWSAMLSEVAKLGTDEFLEWLATQPAEAPPPRGFLKDGATLVRATPNALACTRRHLDVGPGFMLCNAEWSELSACSWHLSTWCGSTAAALTPPPMAYMDKAVPLDELQYDVNVVLTTLIQSGVKDFLAMRGVLGPCVVAGRGDSEIMRTVEWRGDGVGFLTLLPEAYVRFVLADYDRNFTELSSPGPSTVLSSFLILPDDDVVLLRFPDLTGAEQVDAAGELGSRIWKLPSKKVPLPALRLVPPGQRVDTVENQTVFYTASDSSDALEGLTVRWTFAPGGRDLPTLDSANEAFETVVT